MLGIGGLSHASISYSKWINEKESCLPNSSAEEIDQSIILSIVLIAPSGLDDDLTKTSIDSILNQTASNWELLIATKDASYDNSVLKDERVSIYPTDKILHFFDTVNSISKNTQTDFITFMCEGDQLSKNTLTQFTICRVENASAQVIVTDEDCMDAFGQRHKPFFKPNWNPDYLANYNYFSKAVIYSQKLFNDLGGFNGEESDPFHALALRATKRLKEAQICHLDKVLFHFKQPIADKTYRQQFKVPEPAPLVTIIIPTKDHLELFKTCLSGVLTNTAYDNFEIIIIDNQSEQKETLAYFDELRNNPKVSILHYDKPFNYSEMNNLAVERAMGDLICFLNNDISIIKEDWLTEMVSHACRPDIGCVGAKLFYPDGTIQHAGVILGIKGYASHAHKGFAGDDSGYFNRLVVTHNVSAVTAACMVVQKKIFEEVGGFDSENLRVAYNDVDLCLKVREAGYRNLFTPHAQLIHHESKSRGKKRNRKQQKQLKEESEYLVKKWGGVLYSDPAYNKNLTLLREDFSLDMDR